jgi:hypothetical protein
VNMISLASAQNKRYSMTTALENVERNPYRRVIFPGCATRRHSGADGPEAYRFRTRSPVPGDIP